jgi:hypothetical protein
MEDNSGLKYVKMELTAFCGDNAGRDRDGEIF